MQFFHPFDFVGVKIPKFQDMCDDTYEYGFRLNLTTEMNYYTYDWGYGFVVRILGFGFHICICDYGQNK